LLRGVQAKINASDAYSLAALIMTVRQAAVRIGLFSDCEGSAAALEAVLSALKKHAPDLVVCAGDILCCPFSPDPPSETVALLKAEGVVAIPGNHDRYLLDWGTPRWAHTLWMRLRSSDPSGTWRDDVREGQARIQATDLAWLRAFPEELLARMREHLRLPRHAR
jgi:Calcineurin-like phosphoesterase superfamily domain